MVNSPQSPTSPVPPALGTVIDNGALQLVEILGYGGYGIVYRAIDTYSSNPTSYAVKCLPHSNKRSAARQRQLHMREIALHQLASGHPNVVTLHRVVEEPDFFFLLLDYCPGGDLFEYLTDGKTFCGDDNRVTDIFVQIIDAVAACHEAGVYHRDIKPENIFCNEDCTQVYLGDFGLSTDTAYSYNYGVGSYSYMSPGK